MPQAPTYASLQKLLGRVPEQAGTTATQMLRRDGSTAEAAARPEARLAYYVPETGHHVAQVFWDFLQSRGPVGDGSREDILIDWVFAMGYPISEPYWTRVKVGGVEQDVLDAGLPASCADLYSEQSRRLAGRDGQCRPPLLSVALWPATLNAEAYAELSAVTRADAELSAPLFVPWRLHSF